MYYQPYAYPILADNTYLVVGLFEDEIELAAILKDLDLAGIDQDDMSVVMSDDTHDRNFKIEKGNKAGEMAAGIGSMTGIVGAILLGLGSATASPATGGLSLVVAGPLLSSLAGFGGGAALGGVLGALAGVNMPDYEIDMTRDRLEHGHVLLAVRAKEKDIADQTREIFRDHGAINTQEDIQTETIEEKKSNAI